MMVVFVHLFVVSHLFVLVISHGNNLDFCVVIGATVEDD